MSNILLINCGYKNISYVINDKQIELEYKYDFKKDDNKSINYLMKSNDFIINLLNKLNTEYEI